MSDEYPEITDYKHIEEDVSAELDITGKDFELSIDGVVISSQEYADICNGETINNDILSNAQARIDEQIQQIQQAVIDESLREENEIICSFRS